MAANIGGIYCTFVRGSLRNIQELSKVWHVRGLDGPGIEIIGKGDGGFQLLAVFYGMAAAVGQWASDIADLQGAIVSLETDYGQTFTDAAFIKEVGTPVFTPAVAAGRDTRGEITVAGFPIS